MSHSYDFYKEKYREIQEYALDNDGTMYTNIDQFISDYQEMQVAGEKNIMRTLKYYTKYPTGYKTALSEYRKLKELGGEGKLKEIKSMTTVEFADKYKDEIRSYYRDLRSTGITSAAAKALIGVEWFGSK